MCSSHQLRLQVERSERSTVHSPFFGILHKKAINGKRKAIGSHHIQNWKSLIKYLYKNGWFCLCSFLNVVLAEKWLGIVVL